jgi:hypothetical protein
MSENHIKYGLTATIPIEQVVARTKVRLGVKDLSDYDDEIIMFINEGLSSIGDIASFIKKNCKLDIVNGIANLPHDFKRLYGVRLLPPATSAVVQNQPVNSVYTSQQSLGWQQDQVYLERTFLDECRNEFGDSSNTTGLQGIMEIVGKQLRFPIPCEAEECVIAYLGYNTGDDCLLEIHPMYERCISEYCVGMILKTYPTLYPAKENRWIAINDAMNTYAAQRQKIIAEGFATSWDLNRYSVKRILHSLLQNQNSPLLR